MIANWVREAASSTGAPFTGNITLDGTSSHGPTMNQAFGTDTHFHYSWVDDEDSPASRETGIGHLSASTTLVRDQIVETWTSGGGLDRTSPAALSCPAGSVITISQSSALHDESGLTGILEDEGLYIMPGMYNRISATASARTDEELYLPIRVWSPCRVTGFYLGIHSAMTGNVKMCLYEGVTSGDKIIPDEALAISSTGDKVKSVTTPIAIVPGIYFVGAIADATVQMYQGYSSTANSPLIGSHTVVTTSTPYFNVAGGDYATGMPATMPTTTWAAQNGNKTLPLFCLEVAR